MAQRGLDVKFEADKFSQSLSRDQKAHTILRRSTLKLQLMNGLTGEKLRGDKLRDKCLGTS